MSQTIKELTAIDHRRRLEEYLRVSQPIMQEMIQLQITFHGIVSIDNNLIFGWTDTRAKERYEQYQECLAMLWKACFEQKDVV